MGSRLRSFVAANGGRVLGDLGLKPRAPLAPGQAFMIDIAGATAGSTITATGLPGGFTLNSAARTITGVSYLPIAAGFSLTETLAGVANSPRTSSFDVRIEPVTAVPASTDSASPLGIAVAIVGQSNERGQVTPNEAIGGVASVNAYPQAYRASRNPAFRFPVGPATSLAGGYHFKLFDDLFDWGYRAEIVNAGIGSMSMLRDACGQIFDGAAARSTAMRQKRAPDLPGDRGYAGDYMVGGGKVFVCTTGRRAYAFHLATAIDGDNAVAQNLDYVREVGAHATAAAAPDFASAVVGGTVVDGTVTWTCVSATTVYLGYNYGPGACSETRAGFDPFGILRRANEELQRVRDARERIVVIANGQSDLNFTSGQYQGAINGIAAFFANRGCKVHLGLSVYNPSGNNVAAYNTLSGAIQSSYNYLIGGGGFTTDQIKLGPNLYQLMGSTGEMAAGGANFVKDAGQDNIHLNARGAIVAGGHIANSIKAWLPLNRVAG